MGLLCTNIHRHNVTVRPEINNQVDVTVEHPNKIGDSEERVIKEYLFKQIDENPDDYRKVAELLGITVLQLEVFIDKMGSRIIRHPKTRVPLRPTLENLKKYVLTTEECGMANRILKGIKDGKQWHIIAVLKNMYQFIDHEPDFIRERIVGTFRDTLYYLEIAEEIVYYSNDYIQLKKHEEN